MSTREARVRTLDGEPVLFIIDQLCELGGAELALRRIVGNLPRYGYSPRILTFKLDGKAALEEFFSCPIDVQPLRRTYDASALAAARRIRRLVCSENIRITHTFHETADLWAGPIAKMSGCPILISSRRDMGFLRQSKHRVAYRWLGRYFDEVQTVSEEVRQFCIREDGLAPSRVVTICNGVDLPKATPVPRAALRRKLGLPEHQPVVTALGHIRRIKGYDVLVRAASRVLSVMPEVVFAIAGEPHDSVCADELIGLAEKFGIVGHIKFLGPVRDTVSLLRASDVFCLPSRSEGLSNALLEAMACELPCVATRVGGNSEVVDDGNTGFLVESEDGYELAAALLKVLTQPSMAFRMGQKGRLLVEQRFTTERMLEALVQSYDRHLARCRSV